MDAAKSAPSPLQRLGSPAMAKWLALATLALLACAHALTLIGSYDGPKPLYDRDGMLIGRDFMAFWAASDLALDGRAADLADPTTFESHYESKIGPVTLDPTFDTTHTYPWYYPPISLLVVAPLALLPYLWSYGLWIAATLAAYLLSAARRGRALVELPVLLLAPSTLFNFLLGQNGFLSAALLVGGLRLVESRPWLAGVLLGLLSYKPHLGLLVPVALVAGRFWRAFAAASATVLAMLVASLALFGLESWTLFFDTSLGLQAHLLNERGGPALDLAVAPLMSARIAGLDGVARNLPYALLAAFAAWGVFATYRNPRADGELRIAVLLAGVLLASPYGHSYDLPLVSVAVLWCFQHSLRNGFRTGELILLGLVWLLPYLVLLLNAQGVPPGPPLLAAFYAFVLAKANGWLPGRRAAFTLS